MGSLVRVLILSLFLAFLFTSNLPAQDATEPESCDQAIERYQEHRRAFQALKEDCLAEAGVHPRATLDDCPSVSKTKFIGLVIQLERDHETVCTACGGEWPNEALGPGYCLRP